ncbi:MCE family protein [bacterium]|nr:MCE family protein [bacterium]
MLKLSREKRVGIFFIITIFLTIAVIFLFGKIRPFRRGYTFTTNFNHVAGLKSGDDVRLAGLKVGEVSSLEETEEKILVKLWIQERTKIARDSRITIAQVSVMGGKYVAISPGRTKAKPILPEETVEGYDPPVFEDIVSQFGETWDELKDVLINLSDSILKTSDETRQILQENRESVQKLIISLNQIADNLNNIVADVEKGEGTIGKLVKEEELYEETLQTIKQLQETLKDARVTIKDIKPHLKATMENMESITDKLERGEGTLGKLITSDELYEKGKSVIDSTEKISGRASEMMDAYGEFKAVLGYQGDYITNEKGTRHEGFLRIEPSSSSYYLLGISKEPWEQPAKATVQIARRFKDDSITLRSGIIEASLGAGIDYMFPNNKTAITLEGFIDQRDEKPYCRMFLNQKIWKNYYLTLGAADFTDDITFTAGLRIEYDVLGAK